MRRYKILGILAVVSVAAITTTAFAGHIPLALDDPSLWTPLPDDGYLNFMTPTAFIPIMPAAGTLPIAPGGIFHEEHTGWTDDDFFPFGTDHVDPLGPPVWPAGPDNDPFAGDRADFDWVQEHRPHETGVPPISNHPGFGAMGWEIAPTMASPHTTLGVPHGHSVSETPPGTLPELSNNDYAFSSFSRVDVFSVISEGQDFDTDATGAFSPRDAALDYDLWFVDLITGTSVPGVPVKVFVPGWTLATGTDDFVARWKPAIPGFYNSVAIDPAGGFGHDEITEIDAIKAAFIPEPATFSLLLFGGLLFVRRRR